MKPFRDSRASGRVYVSRLFLVRFLNELLPFNLEYVRHHGSCRFWAAFYPKCFPRVTVSVILRVSQSLSLIEDWLSLFSFALGVPPAPFFKFWVVWDFFCSRVHVAVFLGIRVSSVFFFPPHTPPRQRSLSFFLVSTCQPETVVIVTAQPLPLGQIPPAFADAEPSVKLGSASCPIRNLSLFAA